MNYLYDLQNKSQKKEKKLKIKHFQINTKWTKTKYIFFNGLTPFEVVHIVIMLVEKLEYQKTLSQDRIIHC